MIAGTAASFPVYTPRFWSAYFVQMRPYLLFVSGIAGAAGMAIGKEDDVSTVRIVISFLPFFLGYGFGQALTDCFQTDTDKLSAPYRPLSQGIVSVRNVLSVSLAGLVLCAFLFYAFSLASFALSGLAVFGLATYSYIKKHVWIGGPFYNAWIVALLPLMGYFMMPGREGWTVPVNLVPYLFLSFFSYASFVLIGYLKDIEADAATGYKTFPVVWGWKKTVLLGDVFAAATLLLFWFQSRTNVYEVVAGVIGTICIVYGQIKAHATKQENEKGALLPILCTVRSFILFHIAIVLHFQPGWNVYLLVYYLLFEVFLWKRPSVYQV